MPNLPQPPFGLAIRRRFRLPWGWILLFIGPNLALFSVFILIPIIMAFGLSLFQWDLISAPNFVGFANFEAIPSDPRAVNSIIKTLYLIGIGVIPTVLVSFLLAVLTNTW